MHALGHGGAAQHVIERGALRWLHAGDSNVRASVLVARDEGAGQQSTTADRDDEVLELWCLEQNLVKYRRLTRDDVRVVEGRDESDRTLIGQDECVRLRLVEG